MYILNIERVNFQWYELKTPLFHRRDDGYAFTISYQIAQEYTSSQRQIYNFLDWLGDIGGLKDGFIFMGTIVMQIYTAITGSELNSFLLRVLFKVEQQKKQKNREPQS